MSRAYQPGQSIDVPCEVGCQLSVVIGAHIQQDGNGIDLALLAIVVVSFRQATRKTVRLIKSHNRRLMLRAIHAAEFRTKATLIMLAIRVENGWPHSPVKAMVFYDLLPLG